MNPFILCILSFDAHLLIEAEKYPCRYNGTPYNGT